MNGFELPGKKKGIFRPGSLNGWRGWFPVSEHRTTKIESRFTERRGSPSSWLFLGLILALTLGSCMHGKVRMPPPVPRECRNGLENTAACRIASREQAARIESGQKQETVLSTDFYLFGFVPDHVEVDAGAICPDGVYEIHEYQTWMDALLTQITLGIYLPRTARITCY